MTDTSKTTPTGAGTSTGTKAGTGIQIGFLLEFIGAAAVIAAAFFSPLPEKIAVLAGVGSLVAGRLFQRLSA